ncbi:hypothetical protein [Xenorhabdus siamensis]|uniref:hypothetical protein n=2 Tax=Xenorhabdus TaxID=626 RepID=UPI003BF4F952
MTGNFLEHIKELKTQKVIPQRCLVLGLIGKTLKIMKAKMISYRKTTIAAATMAIALSTAGYAASLPNNEVDAYILAMNTMSPITAKYTIHYKQAVEQHCNTSMTVDQLNSKDFTNVVQTMVSSETVDRMGLDAAGSLQDTLFVIGKNVNCSDLNAPFKALLDDKDFNKKHQHLSKVLHTWDEVVSQSK